MKKREYSFGVYYYTDKITGLIDYIGFDSYIDSRYNRNYRHLNWTPNIKFEKILQNNPDRWEYHVFKKFNTLEEASECEYDLINLYRPRFNYKHGGIGVKKFYQDFKYTVVKRGFRNGKQKYVIYDRDNNPIKESINKEALDEIADALNNGDITEEEAKAIDLNPFKYTVAKNGFRNGKQRYVICDRDNNPIKESIDKEALDEIADALNNGDITEEEAKAIGLNPFKYTVVKRGFRNGKQNYVIYDREDNPIKQSINKEALDETADALNNGSITEEEVKSVRGTDKVLEMLRR